MTRRFDPERRQMPIASWPHADRAAWASVTIDGDVLVRSRFTTLRPRTLENYRDAYGRWLTFLARRGNLDGDVPPAARATPPVVAEYVALLQRQVAPLTVALRVNCLELVLREFAPDQDWAWLRAISRRLWRVARPMRDMRAFIRPTDELLAAGQHLMAIAESAIGASQKKRASMHRDGLMLALLAVRPLRLSNFTAIRIDHHLRQIGTSWAIVFAEHETKTKRPLEFPFPDTLVTALETYLSRWRRVLLGPGSSDRLWISSTGRPLPRRSINHYIGRVTQRFFGVSLWPQLLRHCLATHIAIEDPEHVGIASVMLGHSGNRTTGRHYILAGQRRAGQRWQTNLLTRRRAAERRGRSD